jgi:Recombination directionality factor-like
VTLLDVQRRMRELGRIRTGEQVAVGTSGKRRPAKLETFRLTSASRTLIEAAAETYGGKVRDWVSPAGKAFEVVTTADSLPIILPPGQALSQFYELWAGGGCQRRCDGRTNFITAEACECPDDPAERRELAVDGRACKPTTRLNVILPDLPDLGVWRLESHGYYAAVELAGTASFLEMVTASGRMLPAMLRLEQREKKVPGKPTNRFSVPVIELPTVRIADLLTDGQLVGQLGAPRIAPAQLGRPKREMVERPALGPSAALPDETQPFGGPLVAEPSELPLTPTNVDHETGEVLEADEVITNEDLMAEADLPVDEPELSKEAFTALVNAAGLKRSEVVEICVGNFEGRGLKSLTDGELATLAGLLGLTVAAA